MVTTRSSTGRLPTTKRSNLAEGEGEDDEDADEYPAVPTKKRKRNNKIVIDLTEESGGEQSTSVIEGVRDVNDKLGAESVSPDEVVRALTEKKGRICLLLSGPRTSDWLRFSGCTTPVELRKSRVNKRDIGKLSLMLALPIDALYEIACRLKPLDLLNLSRVNGSLYGVFMSKDSRPIWMASMGAIRMPPPPSSLNEPQYVSLHFEKTCQACGYRRAERVMYTLFTRLCKWCIKLNVRIGREMIYEYFPTEISNWKVLLSLLPCREMMITDARGPLDSRRMKFLEVDFVRVVSAYLRTDPDSEERKAFVENQHRFVEETIKHMDCVATWRAKCNSVRENATKEMMTRRQEQIADRLHSLGYSSEEVRSMGSWDSESSTGGSWLQLVNQPKEVTDRIWLSILPKLVMLLDSKREYDRKQAANRNREIRKSELLTHYKDFLQRELAYVIHNAALCIVDLFETPFVSYRIGREDFSVKLTKKAWQEIEDELPRIAEEHLRKMIFDCARLLRAAWEPSSNRFVRMDKEARTSSETERTLDMDTVWRCDAFFSYLPAPYDMQTFAQILSRRRDNMFTVKSYPSWKSVILQVDQLVLLTANALVSSMDLARDTTMERMESLGSKFMCLQCGPLLRVPLTWRELVKHVTREIRDYRLYPQTCDIPLLETHKLSSVYPIAVYNPDIVKPSISVVGTIYKQHCKICMEQKINRYIPYKEELDSHMRTHHGIHDN